MFGVYYQKSQGLSGVEVNNQNNQAQQQQQKDETVFLSDADWKEVTSEYVGMVGDENAKVTMVEFTDYQCPFCQRHFQQTYPDLIKNYVETGKLKILFRDQALSFHPNSNIAAQAVRCAADQDGFEAMHDALFANQQDWVELSKVEAINKFGELASKANLNGNQLSECVKSDKYDKAVKADSQLGTRLGASGTPSFFIEKQLVVGALPFSEFEKVIEQYL